MSFRTRSAGCGIAVAVAALGVMTLRAQQNQPVIGIAPVAVAAAYTFDTAEQHKLRVVVVARGLVHPFSLAFLPNGDALVTERGKGLRLVRQRHGARGGAAALQADAGGRRAGRRPPFAPAACRKWRCTRSLPPTSSST